MTTPSLPPARPQAISLDVDIELTELTPAHAPTNPTELDIAALLQREEAAFARIFRKGKPAARARQASAPALPAPLVAHDITHQPVPTAPIGVEPVAAASAKTESAAVKAADCDKVPQHKNWFQRNTYKIIVVVMVLMVVGVINEKLGVVDQYHESESAAFNMVGGWICKVPMKAPPGFRYIPYYFGPDNVFVATGEDGQNTVFVAGAYQLGDDQQSLRWVEGVGTVLSPSGQVLMPWTVMQPGGPSLAMSNFRDRQSQVLITDPNNIILKNLIITNGPGGQTLRPSSPNNEMSCNRQNSAAAEQAWKEVPRQQITQMLSVYASNPVPQFSQSRVETQP